MSTFCSSSLKGYVYWESVVDNSLRAGRRHTKPKPGLLLTKVFQIPFYNELWVSAFIVNSLRFAPDDRSYPSLKLGQGKL